MAKALDHLLDLLDLEQIEVNIFRGLSPDDPRQRVFGGEDVLAGADLDGAVAAGGADELLDGPAGAVLDEPGDGQGGEHDRQVRVDRFTDVVIDRPGLQVVFGHAEAGFDAPQLVVGVDDEFRALLGEVGGVARLGSI